MYMSWLLLIISIRIVYFMAYLTMLTIDHTCVYTAHTHTHTHYTLYSRSKA